MFHKPAAVIMEKKRGSFTISIDQSNCFIATSIRVSATRGPRSNDCVLLQKPIVYYARKDERSQAQLSSSRELRDGDYTLSESDLWDLNWKDAPLSS